MSEFFDTAAATWDDDPRKIARARLVADAIAATGLTGVTDALEYGAGTGQVSLALAERLGHIVITDASPAMVAVAREHIAALAESAPEVAGRLSASELDLTTDVLPAASLDLIYASLSLHHVPDVPLALSRMATALRPGGRVAIADLDHDPDQAFHGHDFTEHHGHVHHGFEQASLARQLTDAGLQVTSFEIIGEITKSREETERTFPLFLAVASKPA